MMNPKVLEILTETSTWRGLSALTGLIGIKITPEQQTDILTAVGGLFGLIEFLGLKRDKGKGKM